MCSKINVIIGLGNPTDEYKYTRHNIGFTVLDFYLENRGYKIINSKSTELFSCTSIRFLQRNIFFIKPMCYMNNSGSAVVDFFRRNNITNKSILVVHDDVDIEFGRLDLKTNRSSGGHKGVQSIIDNLNTQDFSRLRVGIGKKDSVDYRDTSEYVISNFYAYEKEKLLIILKRSAESIDLILSKNLSFAMNTINNRRIENNI